MASEFQQRTKQWRRFKTRRLMQAESHCGVPNGRNRQSIRAALRQAAPLRGCRADCAALSRAALSNPARSGAYLPRAADFARACRARWEQAAAAAAQWRQVGSHCWSRECLFAARESCHFDCVRQRRSAGEDVRICGAQGRDRNCGSAPNRAGRGNYLRLLAGVSEVLSGEWRLPLCGVL
jgi:hypothetical protein